MQTSYVNSQNLFTSQTDEHHMYGIYYLYISKLSYKKSNELIDPM